MPERNVRGMSDAQLRTHVVIRVLAMPLSLLLFAAFVQQCFVLISEPHKVESVFLHIANTLLFAFLFWPFSYVAVKGKTPRRWLPFQ